MLVAYDADGSVVGTLDYVVTKDGGDNVVGLIDFEAHESAGGRLRDVWQCDGAVGSGTWPEWLGGKAHDFRVELHDSPAPSRAKIAALVHKKSGHRRERAAIEAAVTERIAAAGTRAADVRDIVGGPNRALQLDDDGKTMPWVDRRLRFPVLPRDAHPK